MKELFDKIVEQVVEENEFDTTLTKVELKKQFIKYMEEEGHLEVLVARLKEDVEEMYEGFEPEED